MQALIDSWYQRRWWRFFLWPLSAIFLSVVSLRRWLYRHGYLKTTRFPVPIIVVGNISVGGTGKTPMVILLAKHLSQQGWQVGIVSRGYGGDNQQPRVVTPTSDSHEVGDEALLIAKHSQSPMVICRHRVAAVEHLLQQHTTCDVIITDDGLQHYALARDIEIVMVDGVRRLGNQQLLPMGPLREPVSRLAHVDFIVSNEGQAQTGEYQLRIEPQTLYVINQPQRQQALAAFAGQTVHAVAGIGNPEKFFTSLRTAGVQVIEHPFPDHHRYCAQDISFVDDYPVIMTEKDAVKCTNFVTDNHWCLPIQATVSSALLSKLDVQLKKIKLEKNS